MFSYSKNRVITEKITFGALFAAIAIVLKIFVNFETYDFRISFFEFPILLSGILLGPIYGGIVGFVTDSVYTMVNPHGVAFGYNLFTVSSVMYGLLPGLYFYYLKYNKINISIIIPLTLLIIFFIDTTQLFLWYKYGIIKLLYARITVLIVKMPVFVIIMHYFLMNKAFYNFNIFKAFQHRANIEILE